jgi:hypothetical protein
VVAVPLIGGIIGGAAGALDAALSSCSEGWLDVIRSAGRGFVTGSVGSLAALAVAELGAGALAAGAFGGVTAGFGDQLLRYGANFNEYDPLALGASVAVGGVAGLSIGRIPGLQPGPGTFMPDLTLPRGWRTGRPVGPNSMRILAQEGASSVAGGVGGSVIGNVLNNCACGGQ